MSCTELSLPRADVAMRYCQQPAAPAVIPWAPGGAGLAMRICVGSVIVGVPIRRGCPDAKEFPSCLRKPKTLLFSTRLPP